MKKKNLKIIITSQILPPSQLKVQSQTADLVFDVNEEAQTSSEKFLPLEEGKWVGMMVNNNG